MSLSIKLGNFLYRNAYGVYKPMYFLFKKKQDAFEIALLKKHVRPGDTVLDIGANIGFYAGILSQLVGPQGRVHCFEPDLINFAHLQKTVSGLPNVTALNKAVGSESGSISIYTSKELNVDHRTYKPEQYDREIKTEAVSIDDYLAQFSPVPRVDVIKMDIQGFEMQALAGMKKTLAENKSIKLVSEFWPYGLRTAGSSASAFFSCLSGLGFTCYLLEKKGLKKLDERTVETMNQLPAENYFNILAVKEHV